VTYTQALQAPNRQQWEASSAFSQSWNCGLASAAFISGFYRDVRYGIEYGRTLIAGMGPYYVNGVVTYGAPPKTATTAWQQRDILVRRGVPSTVRYLDSIAELHSIVGSGRRPVIVGILMSRVPGAVRGHSFLGWHAVVVICTGWLNGVKGFWVMDPNFAAGSSGSRRFYSNDVMQWAWAANAPRWCVVPNNAKALPVAAIRYIKFNVGVDGVNIRTAPNSRVDNVFAIAWKDADPPPNGIVRRSTKKRIASTATKRRLIAVVNGTDGIRYVRFRIGGTTADVYAGRVFMNLV
jgi:hypothetical protein